MLGDLKRFMLMGSFWGLMGFAWAMAEDAAPKNEPAAGKLTLSTERLVVFKDGYGLFVKNATGTADKDGRAFTDAVPDGVVLGTFWASSDQKKPVGIYAEWIEKKEERSTEIACSTTADLLRANKGKKVTLGLTREKTPEVSGTLVEVLDLPPEKPAAAAATARPAWGHGGDFEVAPAATPLPSGETIRDLGPRGAQLVAIDTEQGRMVLTIAEVRCVSGAELITKFTHREEVTTHSKRLSFDLGKEAALQKANLKIIYFSEGVRWIPTYRVSGGLEEKAEIALQGEIINEAEDLNNAALDLVVGVPNFRYKQTISPLSLERAMRQALLTAAPNLMSNPYSNGNFQQQAGVWNGRAAREEEGAAGALNLAPELGAAGQQDLFVYGVKTFTIKKGGRATIPLWQNVSPLRHLYTLDVKVLRDPRSGSASGRARNSDQPPSPLKLAEQQVWHQYELGNTSAVPWTTGAAMILREQIPLGQEMLTYTPAGSTALLPVTVAVDMCGKHVEEELARQPNALQWSGYSLSLVKKRATISVNNLRKEKSVTRVTASFGGRAESVSDGGKIVLNDNRADDWSDSNYGGANNHSDITWEFTLEPGQTKTLTYEFKLYVH